MTCGEEMTCESADAKALREAREEGRRLALEEALEALENCNHTGAVIALSSNVIRALLEAK